VIAGREVISFAPGRDGKVSVPVEQLEELLFEAGYNPAVEEPGLDSSARRESSPP
jgi:hypothetical protein